MYKLFFVIKIEMKWCVIYNYKMTTITLQQLNRTIELYVSDMLSTTIKYVEEYMINKYENKKQILEHIINKLCQDEYLMEYYISNPLYVLATVNEYYEILEYIHYDVKTYVEKDIPFLNNILIDYVFYYLHNNNNIIWNSFNNSV